MEINIYIKGKDDPIMFKGDKIDILDIKLENQDYKQIRYFRNGISKSQYINSNLIKKIKNLNR